MQGIGSALVSFARIAVKDRTQAAVIGATVVTTLFAKYAWDQYQVATWQGMVDRSISVVRSVPWLGEWLVESKLDKEKAKITEEVRHAQAQFKDSFARLSNEGLSAPEIQEVFQQRVNSAPLKPEQGKISGTQYHNVDHLKQLQAWIGERAMLGNPLHPDVHAMYIRMEAEVASMVGDFFHGGHGYVTAGGTDSIIHACLAYRRHYKHIAQPEMLIPESAHAAFEKAAEMFKIRLKKIPCHPDTGKVRVEALRDAIGPSTILIVGSAPSYPYGVVDPIDELSAIAKERGIGLHVDACLGGLVAACARDLPTFDFRLEGVTSISADTHKYGFAPKGSSVVLYRTKELRGCQMSKHTDWMGGVYVTPGIAGSRAGAPIAQAWATLLALGRDGYQDAADKIIAQRASLQEAIESFEELEVIGDPKLSVVAMRSSKLSIYALADLMKKRGWEFNALQPEAMHFCVTLLHVEKGEDFVGEFKADMASAIEELKDKPELSQSSTKKLYGTVQSIPGSLVDEVSVHYWNEQLSLN